MISLSAKTRNIFGKKTKAIKNQGLIPAVVYGPGVKNASVEVEEKEFVKVFRKAGESSLVELSIEGEKEKMRQDVEQDAESLVRSGIAAVLGRMPAAKRDELLIKEAMGELKNAV